MNDLFNGELKGEHRLIVLARLMNLNLNDKNSWPIETMERILKRCEQTAIYELNLQINYLMLNKGKY
jgi:hypothetical protein